jgi:hypothetical protein
MATELIHNFTSTATSPAGDDYLPLDGATNGTRKWSSSHFQNLGTGDSPTFANVTATSAVTDVAGNVRTIPQNVQAGSYSLLVGDAGKHVYTASGVTVPASVFSVGQAVSIVNSGTTNLTVTQGTSATVYLAGSSTTGNRTLAQKGICTVLCVASNTFIIGGAGLT